MQSSRISAWFIAMPRPSYLNAVDALLVHLRKDPLFEITIPSKTQAYMAAGKPLLMAVDGDAADLLRQSGGGVVVAPAKPLHPA